jgi:uncharacterized membrane protein YkoI
MNMKNYLVMGALAASTLAGAWVFASQHPEGGEAVLRATERPAISLAQAVAIAEQHAQGNAIGAELERDGGSLHYDVEVANAGRTVEVKVDGSNGAVIGVDRDDRDDESHGEHDRS